MKSYKESMAEIFAIGSKYRNPNEALAAVDIISRIYEVDRTTVINDFAKLKKEPIFDDFGNKFL